MSFFATKPAGGPALNPGIEIRRTPNGRIQARRLTAGPYRPRIEKKPNEWSFAKNYRQWHGRWKKSASAEY